MVMGINLMISDIKQSTLLDIRGDKIAALYWDDFTEDFKKRYTTHIGDKRDFYKNPLVLPIDQVSMKGNKPLFVWE